jgi:hypothetical protein
MAVTEPYSDVLTGIATRLVNASGPFTTAGQIGYAAPTAEGGLDPVERLVSMTTKEGCQAAALIADGGSDFGGKGIGDSGSNEEWRVVIHYAVRCPGGSDWKYAYTGNEGKYWGEFEVRRWLLDRLHGYSLGGTTKMHPYPVSRANSLVTQNGMIICSLTFAMDIPHDITT